VESCQKQETRRLDSLLHWEWALLLLLLVAAFFPVLREMYALWMAPGSYSSHAPLVPLISAWFVWRQRAQLQAMPRHPAKSGLLLIAFSLLVLIGSGVLRVYTSAGIALLLCLTGMVAYWGGWRWLGKLWFPLAFLIFMLPIPEILIARLNLSLKLMVMHATVFALQCVRVPVAMDGATLHLAGGDMIVGDVCAGLRSLTALITLAALFAYMQRRRPWPVPAAVLAIAVPAALGGNIVRIFLDGLLVNAYGPDLLFSPLLTTELTGAIDLHTISGVVLFGLVLLALNAAVWLTEACVRWVRRAKHRNPPLHTLAKEPKVC
jgi:exosortase